MQIVALLRTLWRNLFRRQRVEQAFDDELRAYIDLLAADFVRAGMAPDEARRAALISAGGFEQVKETTRDSWLGNSAAVAARELRFALRSLRRAPTFAAVATLTLAIGIGGTTAVYTVIKGSLLRPLPGAGAPDRLFAVERVQPIGLDASFSYPDFRDFNAQSTATAGLAGFDGTSMTLEDSAGSGRTWVSWVTDNFFAVLDVRPGAGRFFLANETEPVVVLGDALWRRRFAGSARAIGSTINLDGRAFTIVGVAPPGFIGAMATHPMDLWIPLALGGKATPVLGGFNLASRRDTPLRLIGRLATGKSLDDARRDLDEIARRLAPTRPNNRSPAVVLFPRIGMTADERDEASRLPTLLAVAVAMLLLIANSNVAGLSLVRMAARHRELATRVALGASRPVLVRHVAIEGAVVAAAAGLLGVGIAQLLVRSTTLVNTVVSVPDADLSMDPRVLAIAIAASTLTAILVSLLPALQIIRLCPGAVLKDGGGAGRRSTTGQRVLVAGQLCTTLVMLSAAAVIFSAFHRVLDAHNVFDPSRLTEAWLEPDRSIKDTARQVAFYRELLARAAAEPEVAAAALATTVPPFQWSGSLLVFRRGEEPPPGSSAERRAAVGIRVNAIRVSERFFDAMNIAIVRGRAFTESDTPTSELGAIVNRRLAAILWPGQDPIGRVLTWPPIEGPARPPLRVIGVAEDTRDPSLAADAPLAMYMSFAQRPNPRLNLLLRARAGSVIPAATIRRLVAAVDPSVTVVGGETLRDRLQSHVRQQRTASAWVGVFALIALVLASVGLYGIVAQGVLQRRRELAVRSALGATPLRIVGGVIGSGMRITLIGTIAGGLASIVTVRILASYFAGVRTDDIKPTLAAAVALTGAMFVAAYGPARRALRLSPAEVLRSD